MRGLRGRSFWGECRGRKKAPAFSLAHPESVDGPLDLFFVDLHVLDLRVRWPLADELQCGPHRARIAFEAGLHPAVVQVAHPARNAEFLGTLAGRMAKPDAMNPAGDDRVGAQSH